MGKILERDALIKDLASQNKTVAEIRQALIEKFDGCDNNRLRQRLVKFGFTPISEGSGGKNRKINTNIFYSETEVSFYWVGYISADGNISKNSNTISITSKDIEHLLKFQQLAGGLANEHRFVNEAGSNMIAIYFGNKDIKIFLEHEYGLVPNKSKILKLTKMNSHILRGIFDGDGTASKEVKITTASKNMRDDIIKFLESKKISSYFRVKGNNMDCYDIVVRPKFYLKFYNLIYKNATVFLERKQKAMWALIK